MEGVPVTVDEVRRILAGDAPPDVRDADRRLVEGYRDAMSYVLRRADDPAFSWRDELILALHDKVLGGSHELGAGRFREGQVYVAVPGAERETYRPPAASEVSTLVRELADYVQGQSGHVAPPVLAALVHVALAGIHPFKDGNGRTARVLASLAMYRGGYVRPEFTSLEEWWGTHKSDYYGAFACLGTGWDPGTDVTGFVEAHVSAQRLQADALSLREATQRQLWTLLEDIATEDLGMPPRAADALFDAFFGRSVTNRYYRSLCDVSTATATNDLARLEASGLLRAQGRGRSRSYTGADQLLEAVALSGGLGEAPTGGVTEDLRAWVVAKLAERVGDGGPDQRYASIAR